MIVNVAWTLFRQAHPLARHHHSLLFIQHAYVTLVEYIGYHSDRSPSQSQLKVIPLCLNLVLPSSPISSTLFTFCKHGMNKQISKKFQDSSKAQVHLTIMIIISHYDYE